MVCVLVVDDEMAIRALLLEMIVELGHRVLEARNGAEGLTLARLHRPDLIIADVHMPLLDGYALLHALREDSALAGCTIVLMSAASTSVRPDHAPPDHYLAKPFALIAIEQLLAHLPAQKDSTK